MKTKHILLGLRIIIAVILIQTLRFKFTAHPDSVYIFETLGLEPYGRIGIGVLELAAGLLLLYRKTVATGALLAVGLMAGAIFSHITQLGIVVQEDNGVLFYTAVVTFILSAAVLFSFRKEVPFVGKYLTS